MLIIIQSYINIRGKDWGAPSKSCAHETEPFFGVKYPAGTPMSAVVVNKVLSRIKVPTYLLDITLLSQYRKDAHPTVYSGGRNSLDCSHWCLPGLPDTWNQLFYTALLSWTSYNWTYIVQAGLLFRWYKCYSCSFFSIVLNNQKWYWFNCKVNVNSSVQWNFTPFFLSATLFNRNWSIVTCNYGNLF